MAITISTTLARPYQLQQLMDAYSDAETYPFVSDLSDAKDQLVTDMQSDGRTFVCPKCKGNGTHALSLDTGLSDDEATIIPCTMVTTTGVTGIECDGWGYLSAPAKYNTPFVTPAYEGISEG